MEERYKSVDIPENMVSDNRIENIQGGLVDAILDYEKQADKKAVGDNSTQQEQQNNSESKISFNCKLPIPEPQKNRTEIKMNLNSKRSRGDILHKYETEKNIKFLTCANNTSKKSGKNTNRSLKEENKNCGEHKVKGKKAWLFEGNKQPIILNDKNNLSNTLSALSTQENINEFNFFSNKNIDLSEEVNEDNFLDLNAAQKSGTNDLIEQKSRNYMDNEPDQVDYYFNYMHTTFHPLNDNEETLNETLDKTEV